MYKIKEHSDKSASEPIVDLSSKEQFLFFVEEHRGLVWGGILLLVVLVGGLVTVKWVSTQKLEEAWALQGKAQMVYLDRPLDNVDKGKNNIQQATGLFQDIIKEYPATPSAKVSSFLLGNSLMEAENHKGAIDVYTNLIQNYSGDPILVGLVQQRLGLAQLLTGDRAAAVQAFNAVLKNPQALNKDQVMFELAKLAESEEKINDAVTHYKQLIQEFPLSPLSTEANLRVKVLAPEDTSQTTNSENSAGSETGQETLNSQNEDGDHLTEEGSKE